MGTRGEGWGYGMSYASSEEESRRVVHAVGGQGCQQCPGQRIMADPFLAQAQSKAEFSSDTRNGKRLPY